VDADGETVAKIEGEKSERWCRMRREPLSLFLIVVIANTSHFQKGKRSDLRGFDRIFGLESEQYAVTSFQESAIW
jgi:hypothetical protein